MPQPPPLPSPRTRLRRAQRQALAAMLFLLALASWLTRQPPTSYPIWPGATAETANLLEINDADSAAWEALPHIGPATARRIVRFRRAIGGQFYNFDQLARVWGMDTLLPRIRHRLVLDSSKLQRIEINTADTLAWRRLPGIYPALARRIVRYRTARGGFRRLDDLGQVWGFDSLYHILRPFLYIQGVSLPGSQARTDWLVFDPPRDLNTLSLKDLEAARLVPRWLAERILKYRDAAGGYDSLGQLRRLYGMTDTLYQRLALNLYVTPPPDTTLDAFAAYRIQRSLGYNQPPAQRLNLNTVDALALESLPQLGPALARRIIERRQALGFFHSLSQLEEVYGLRDSVQVDLRQWLYVEADLGRYPHLHVNIATVEELAAHPYVSYSLARRMVRYRQQHGPYPSADALQRIGGVDATTWRILEPYWVFD